MDNVKRFACIILMTIIAVFVVCMSANCGTPKLVIGGMVTLSDDEMNNHANATIHVQLKNSSGEVIANGKVYGMDLPVSYRIVTVDKILDKQEYIVCAMATNQYGRVQWAAFEYVSTEQTKKQQIDLTLNQMQIVEAGIDSVEFNEIRFMRNVSVVNVDDFEIKSSWIAGWTSYFISLENAKNTDTIYHSAWYSDNLKEGCIYDLYYTIGNLHDYPVGSEWIRPQYATGKVLIGYVLKGCGK